MTPTLSIPIDTLTVADLKRIHQQLVRRYIRSDGGAIVITAINTIRRELKAREEKQ